MRAPAAPRSFLPHLVRVKAATCFGRRITPPFVTLYVTTRCDEKCVHCYYWDQLNPRPNRDFTFSEFDRTLASMGEIFNLFIGGGEPFLRSDLADVILAARDRNGIANVYVPTNAQHSARVVSTLERVLARAPGLRFHLNLSIDHVDEEEHDRIRGRKGALRRTLGTVAAIEPVRRNHPNLIVHTLTTVMKDNQADILRIHEGLKRLVDPDGTSYNYCRGSPLDPAQTDVDPAVYRELAERVRQDRRSGRARRSAFSRVNHSLDDEVRKSVERTVLQRRPQFSCVSGRLACVIYSDGDVTECETKNSRLGNLRDADYDFPSLWFGERAERIAAEAADGCYCTHECGHYASTIYSVKRIAKVAARSAVPRAIRSRRSP